MIHLYIGEGKGKTTAAVGQAIRSLGWNCKVLFSQFLKSGNTGEKNTLTKLEGLTFIRPNMRHKGFIWHMNEREITETREDIGNGFNEISQAIFKGNFSMAVLDEVLDIVDCGFLADDCLLSLLDKAPSTEFILTGRKASDRIMDKADYITVMTKLKHPYDKGMKARRGIEY